MSYVVQLLNRYSSVEECDATMFNQATTARQQNFLQMFTDFICVYKKKQ